MSPAAILLTTRGLRAFGDGLIAVLLPRHLVDMGFDAFTVGLVTTATLVGSSILTLWVGLAGHRLSDRRLLAAACGLAVLTGLGFALAEGLAPILIIAFIGTLNPSAGDVSLFLPVEQALLSQSAADERRTALFARYALVGAGLGALGSLTAGLLEPVSALTGMGAHTITRGAFLLYSLLALAAAALYRLMPVASADAAVTRAPLGPSRRPVLLLAALFSLDSFGGGFLVQSLMLLWLYEHLGFTVAQAGQLYFCVGLLGAASLPVAAWLARHIGLVRTMVFTHIPAGLCVMVVPFLDDPTIVVILLLIRAALSQMDVPARGSYVMAIVTPAERAAAASVTAVPRSLASALSPILAGWLMTLSPIAWPLVLGGGIKIAYDLLLLAAFGHVRPPEERSPSVPK